MSRLRNLLLAAFSFSVLSAGAASAEVVCKVGVDWIGNDIIVEAVSDPEVKGITCH
ncbi:CREA protein, partial [Rhizobium ruizarguesonis]